LRTTNEPSILQDGDAAPPTAPAPVASARGGPRERRRPRHLAFVVGARRSGTTLLNHILGGCAGASRTLSEAQPLTHLAAAFAWCDAGRAAAPAAQPA
jgi:hypothetical protein